MSTKPPSDDDLLTEAEAAAELGVKPSTTRVWRWKRIGPSYIKIGDRIVRYSRGELRRFKERGIVKFPIGPQRRAPTNVADAKLRGERKSRPPQTDDL
jgi:hypothetical protein